MFTDLQIALASGWTKPFLILTPLVIIGIILLVKHFRD